MCVIVVKGFCFSLRQNKTVCISRSGPFSGEAGACLCGTPLSRPTSSDKHPSLVFFWAMMVTKKLNIHIGKVILFRLQFCCNVCPRQACIILRSMARLSCRSRVGSLRWGPEELRRARKELGWEKTQPFFT